MSNLARTSLTALALIASVAAVSQTTAAADRGCKDTGAPSALSAQLKSSTARTAVMAQRAPAGRVVAKPCDDKKTAVQKAPAKLQAKPAQPTRLKVKLKTKIGKKTLTAKTAPTGPKKPGGKLGVIDNGDGGGRIPGGAADGFATKPGGDGVPYFVVSPGQTANVPMKHGNCPPPNFDGVCQRHVIANENGDVAAHGTLQVHCAPGQNVTRLSVVNAPYEDVTTAANLVQGSPQESYSVQVEVEFTSAQSVESAGYTKLGYQWNYSPETEEHPSTGASVQGIVLGDISMLAECDGNDVETATYRIVIPATFHDLDYPYGPTPGIVRNQHQELAN